MPLRVRRNVVWAPGAKKTSGPYRGGPPKALLHATITPSNSLPGYNNQSTAPHETLLWNPATKVLRPVTHYYFDQYAKALQNLKGGVETNADSVLQWELAGYLAETTPRGQFDILEAPNTYWEQLADIIGPVVISWGVKDKFSRSFTGKRNVRMSMSEWNGWDGFCTHADSPENHHWDLPVPPHVAPILSSKIWGSDADMPLTDQDVVKVWAKPMTKTGTLPYGEEAESMLEIITRTAREVSALLTITRAQQELIVQLINKEDTPVDVEALVQKFEDALSGITVTTTLGGSETPA